MHAWITFRKLWYLHKYTIMYVTATYVHPMYKVHSYHIHSLGNLLLKKFLAYYYSYILTNSRSMKIL